MKRLLLLLLWLLIPFEADAILYVAGSTTGSSAGAVTITLPANVADDIILLAVENNNETASITSPAGYAEIDTQANMATGTPAAAGALRLAIFWKRSTGSESNPVIADSGDHQHVQCIIIRGAATSGNPWDVEAGAIQATTNTSVSWQSAGIAYSSPNTGTLTTTVNGDLVLGFIANGFDSATPQGSAEACAQLNNLVEVLDGGSALGNGGGITSIQGIMPGIGDIVNTTTKNFTATLANTSPYALFIIAMKPQVTAPIYIGSGASVGNAAAITPSVPNGIASGDILLTVIQTSNQTASITAPSGFAEIDAQASMGTGTAASAGSLRMALFWKRSDGTETTVSVADSVDHQIAQVFAFRNCIASGNPYDTSESVAVQATGSTSASWQSASISYGSNGGAVTTTVPNTLVLTIIANGTDNAAVQASAQVCGALTNYAPLAFTTISVTTSNTTAGTGGGFNVFAGEKATAGSVVATSGTPTGDFTATLAASSAYAMAVIPLKPVVTGITEQQKSAFFMLFP